MGHDAKDKRWILNSGSEHLVKRSFFGLIWRLTLGWISDTQVPTAGSEWNCSVADGYAV